MENETLSDRLKFALKILGVSQTDLAKQIRVKPQIIQYICSSGAEKSKFTFDIAEALNIDVLWLATGKGASPTFLTSEKSNEKAIPILDFAQIKEWKINLKSIELKTVPKTFITDEINKDSFAFILNDKSMAPKFELNTIVIIEPTSDIFNIENNNKFILAYLAKEDFLVFRQLNLDNKTKTLIPINNSLYKSIQLCEKDMVLGICKEARWNL